MVARLEVKEVIDLSKSKAASATINLHIDLVNLPDEDMTNLMAILLPNGEIELFPGLRHGGQWVYEEDSPVHDQESVIGWAEIPQLKGYFTC